MDYLVQKGAIKGLPLPGGGVYTCQLFADDNSNIIKCETESIHNMITLYEEFCLVSGSKIAHHKTECLILGLDHTEEVLAKFGLKSLGVGCILRYLGCPVGVGITGHQCFEWLMQRIKVKLQSKNHLRLSLAGRLVALQHMLVALPVYVATILKFSSSD